MKLEYVPMAIIMAMVIVRKCVQDCKSSGRNWRVGVCSDVVVAVAFGLASSILLGGGR